MKFFAFSFAFLAAALLFSFVIVNDTFKVKTDSSTVKWVGKKAVGQHNGTLKFSAGNIVLKKNKLVGGQFSVDMNSLICLDVTDADMNKKLVGHLKADDFFGAAKYPTADFVITKVEDKGENNYKVTGDMTIKGVKKPVSFDAQIRAEGNTAKATATVVVDRTQFGITYKSKSFFESIGDKFIYDEFTLELEMAFEK